ncbi:hypothetical protein [Moellerella wisconsensis]|uniref:Uncharacterized protein n=1 Tax=Moellerella wisconsensis TaxID=158849 RepID=A0ACD3YAK8_9GAMM|nr:hypothetical protein [Moellerella wisconsensis]UNH40192.1 hypothetical protein MNY70_07110 [Moellerella wisconsensis]
MSELTLKIQVDTTDLDKAEAQLKRINDLLVSTGMKKPASGGFIADTFGVFKCQGGGVFIPEPRIGAASIRQLSELMNNKDKEAVKEIAKQSPTTTMTITTGVNYNTEQQSAIAKLDDENKDAKISDATVSGKIKVTAASVLANIQETAELIEKSQSEREETKQRLDKRFNEIQSQITSFQCASASDIAKLAMRINALNARIDKTKSAISTSVRTLREEIARARSGWW